MSVKAQSSGLQSQLVFGALLPLFVATEGMHRLYARLTAHGETIPPTRPWLVEARSSASIAASYAQMARSMLQ